MSVEKVTTAYLKKIGFSLPYTIILNETIDIIPDNAALGVYLYLARKPEDWKINEKDVMRRFNKGRDHVRKCFGILKEIGLVKIKAIKDENNKILYWTTNLYSQITENPSSGKSQITENPECGFSRRWENQTHTKTRDYTKERNNKNKADQNLTTEPPSVDAPDTDLSVVVFSFSVDKQLIELRRQYCADCNTELDSVEWLKQAKAHIDETMRYRNITQLHAINMFKKMVRTSGFEVKEIKKSHESQNKPQINDDLIEMIRKYKQYKRYENNPFSMGSVFDDDEDFERCKRAYESSQIEIKNTENLQSTKIEPKTEPANISDIIKNMGFALKQ